MDRCRDVSKFGIGNSIGKHGLKLCGCLLDYLGGAMINLCGSQLDTSRRDPQIVRGAVAILATGFLLYKAYGIARACIECKLSTLLKFYISLFYKVKYFYSDLQQ